MKKKAFMLSCLIASGFWVHAQQSINAAGGSATINGMQFDYSIGEMVLVSTEHSSKLIVTQGLLQPAAGKSTTQDHASGLLDEVASAVKVYPNPTSTVLFAEFEASEAGQATVQLFDALGKLLWNNTIAQRPGNNKVEMDMRPYAAGTYYLMLQTANTQHYSFKVQKLD